MKTILKAHSSTAFLQKDFVVGMLMYFRAEIIFVYGNLRPVAAKLQLSLWEVRTAIVEFFFSSKTKGNTFPGVLYVRVLFQGH